MSDSEIDLTKKEKKEKKERKEREKKEKKQRKEMKKTDSNEEISIDLDADVPLSRKEQRALKKGKLRQDKPEIKTDKEVKSEHGVWIGNLAYDTSREDLIKFLVVKTSHHKALAESEQVDLVRITEPDIVRVNIPKKGDKIKGFAYVDFTGPRQVVSAVSLSETELGGRRLLIKDANSFEGRPKKETSLSKNPPSKILFVGNLSFDTTEDLLEEHFRHCGTISRIRMATFEDSGKCKGFAFIDFTDEEGPTTALKSKLAKSLVNRPLRLEYGEDRSKRQIKRGRERTDEPFLEIDTEDVANDYQANDYQTNDFQEQTESHQADFEKPKRRKFNNSNSRTKSSVALANAQRASAAILPSTGKKVKFD